MNVEKLKIRFTRFEIIWFTIAIIAIVISQILFKASLIASFAAICAIINVILVAKRSIWNFLFGAIANFIYIFINFYSGNFGQFLIYLFFYFPIQIIGLLVWYKYTKIEKVDAKVIVEKGFGIRGWIIVIANLIIGIYLTYKLLPIIASLLGVYESSSSIFDAIATYTGITAGVMMILRYKEQWYLWIMVNIGSIILWISLIGKSESVIPSTIMFVAFLLNAIYGLVEWSRGENGK